MDAQTLLQKIKCDSKMSDCCAGVGDRAFAERATLENDQFIIANTLRADNTEIGHWICFYRAQNGRMEMFDSIGEGVQQRSSDACGHHCLMFAYYRCRSLSFAEILSMYSVCDRCNDGMVVRFVRCVLC